MLPDQGWLNAVYLWEKFDIGQEYNTCASMLKKQQLLPLMHNATIIHFAGQDNKPDSCITEEPWGNLCEKWKRYRKMLPWEDL